MTVDKNYGNNAEIYESYGGFQVVGDARNVAVTLTGKKWSMFVMAFG